MTLKLVIGNKNYSSWSMRPWLALRANDIAFEEIFVPLYTGEGVTYGHTGNRAPGFQPYDTFRCKDGWVFIGALGGPIYNRVVTLLGLDPVEYSYDACSKAAAAVNSKEGRELDQRLRDYCAARTALDVESTMNAARIG